MATGLNFDIFAKDKTAQAFDSVRSKIGGLGKSFDGLKNKLTSLKGLIAAAFSIAYFKGVGEAASRINDLSVKLGISTEVLSQYQFVAGQVGVDIEAIGKAMQMLGNNVATASKQTGGARDALNELGINAEKLKKLSIDQQFEIIGEKISKIENPADRVRLAMDLMGKSGADMIQVFDGGSDAIRKMREEADKLGLTLSQEQASAIDNMMDAWGNFKMALDGVAKKILAYVAPALERLANFLTTTLVGAFNIGKAVINAFVETITGGFAAIIRGIAFLSEKLSILPGQTGQMFANMAESLRGFSDKIINATTSTDALAASTAKLKPSTDIEDLMGQIKGSMPSSNDNKLLKERNDLLAEAKRIYEETRSPFEIYYAQLEKINKLLKMGLITQDTFNRASKKANETLMDSLDATKDKVKDTMETIKDESMRGAESLADSFVDSLFGIGQGFGSLKETALSALRDIGTALFKNALGLNSIGSGAGGGVVGGLVNNLSSFFGGFFADGGNFYGGKPIMVGERGAEMIIPRTGGYVVPNHQMGGNVNVVMNIQTPDVAGFKRSESQIAAGIAQTVRRGSRNL